MEVKLAFFLGLFLVVTVNIDGRHASKTCQGPSSASGGTVEEMIGQLFPCNVEQTNEQPKEHEEAEVGGAQDVSSQHSALQDFRYNQQRSEEIALSVLDLSQRLTENMLRQSKKKYEIISPISVASALQLALLGSHGTTFSELMDLMDYNTKTFSQFPYQIHEEFGLLLEDLVSNSPNPARFRPKVPWRRNASKEYEKRAMKYQSKEPNYDEHKISVANGIFIQRDFSIRDEFKEVVQNVYRSELKSLDFRREPEAATKFINDWVNEKTNGKIKEIISGNADTRTRIILANALYFKAGWQETFIKGVTEFKAFYPNGKSGNESIMVELMAHGGNFPHYYDAESDCEILGLPYKQNATTMYVILPKNSSGEKLRAAQKVLTAGKIEWMISQMVIKTAIILFPKMHLTSGHCLRNSLKELGLDTMFDPYKGDFSVMSEDLGDRPNSAQARPSPPRQSSAPLKQSSLPNRLKPSSQTFDPNEQLIFGRVDSGGSKRLTKRDVGYKTESELDKNSSPLSLKDFMLRKRIVKKSSGKKLHRNKRQYTPFSAERLDAIRNRKDLVNPHLYADEVLHKVDLDINEEGTEGGAATAITLNRSGTSVVFRVDTPFMFLIRHDPTHVPLFYGVVFEPEN